MRMRLDKRFNAPGDSRVVQMSEAMQGILLTPVVNAVENGIERVERRVQNCLVV